MSYSSSSTVPIEMLPGIGRRTAKVLRSMQVLTVGQFVALPQRLLIELFGPSIQNVYHSVHQTSATSQLPIRQKSFTTKQPLRFSQKFRLATQLLMM